MLVRMSAYSADSGDEPRNSCTAGLGSGISVTGGTHVFFHSVFFVQNQNYVCVGQKNFLSCPKHHVSRIDASYFPGMNPDTAGKPQATVLSVYERFSRLLSGNRA